MMLLRMEYPLWSDEDLMTRVKDKELSEKKVCFHRGKSKLDNSLVWYHCDNCGKRY